MSTPRPPSGILVGLLLVSVGLAAVLASSFAIPEMVPAPLDPLAQDTGTAGLKQLLLRLRTTARLMHTTAHPDDEDGGMLTLESRGKGTTVLLLTLNRGEGGQNRVGSNLFDELGVLRTLELLASDKYYGVEQRFTRVVDFGFSKSPEESFRKWGGHDTALADMVRVIRTFRPDVLVSRFQGTARDGHGHHEAAGILTKEAFRAAADANRFPEQIQKGLQPWQAKKLYTDNVRGSEDYSLAMDTGANNPALGMSYVQFAMQGLRHQLSQGAGAWQVEPGEHLTYYKLVDSVLPRRPSAQREHDFFDGIDTSLPALADRLGSEQPKVSFLRPALVEFDSKVKKADGEVDKDAQHAAVSLLDGLTLLNRVISQVEKSDLSPTAKKDTITVLRDKAQQCEAAANLAMNVSLEATVGPTGGPTGEIPKQLDALTIVSPGQTFTAVVKFHNGSKQVLQVEDVGWDGADDWVQRAAYRGQDTVLRAGDDYYANFQFQVPEHATYTRPYFHRSSPEDAVYQVDNPEHLTLPFPPPRLRVHLRYSITRGPGLNLMLGMRPIQAKRKLGPGGQISAPVVVPYLDESGVEHRPSIAIGPRFSVLIEPVTQVLPRSNDILQVTLKVRSNVPGPSHGVLRLLLPASWQAKPTEVPANFTRRDEERKFTFSVLPANLREQQAELRAVFDAGGKEYKEGYSVVRRPDLDTFYYYQPAVQHVSVVDVKVLKNLKVGYIMGAGDDIPPVLRELGMNVSLISPQEMASGELNGYNTVIAGIRAYDTREDVRANNRRLLDYVSNGGTLLVQYNQQATEFNSGNYTPYPAHESRDRVTVEEAPVEMLAPQDGVFHFPNEITARDFDGWVQERGLYFMDQWDSHFEPLLASHDPGEQPLKGGLLRARYGKGTYIYTGYSFFRQLPNGVPGAIRLYVNLLSLGIGK